MSENNVITCAQKYWRLMRQFHRLPSREAKKSYKSVLQCAAFTETKPYIVKRYLAKVA